MAPDEIPSNVSKKQYCNRRRTETAAPADKAKAEASISKDKRLLELLAQEGGANFDSLQQSLGWQKHTVRAGISGLHKAGLVVHCERGPEGPVYRSLGSVGV